MNVGNYLGIPFVEHGRNRCGADCWGLARMVLQEQFGIELPLLSYPSSFDVFYNGWLFQQNDLEFRKHWQKVECPQEGDIVVLRVLGHPAHVGLMVDGTQFLHTEKGINSAVEDIKNSKWVNRIDSFWRHESRCQSA